MPHSDRTNSQVALGGYHYNEYSKFAGGDTAEAWTFGAKYDANNVYLAMMYAETRNMTPYGNVGIWICPYISRHLLSLNPLLARCRRYSRGER